MDTNNTDTDYSNHYITIQMEDRSVVQSHPPPPPYSPTPSHTSHITSPFIPSSANFQSQHQFFPQNQDQHQLHDTSHLHNTSRLYRAPTLSKIGQGAETPSLYAHRHVRRIRRTEICCYVVGFLLLLAIALAVAGGVFHWRRQKYCVEWDDGSMNVDCRA